ncbi:MAG: DNA methylase [Lachnospiraceae bacterium]|nr:DNA methylase [Lachnospiraceae bacterium]
MNRVYISIDLKSFFASVECVERGLDPLTTNLVVADMGRTEKTICLAVTPTLKKHGISGRARLFEVIQRIREVNASRRQCLGREFKGKSYSDTEISNSLEFEVDYIVAPPRMAKYVEYSTRIYDIYLKYIAPEDIHVYSIDEVFMDVTGYLSTYGMTPEELAMKIILDVLKTTGITATAGIGSNLYLSKVAMDIEAKHIQPDKNGVRIARLDEMTYRKRLWSHRPITDFWRVGKGYAKKLEANGIYTMGDVARCSIGKENEYYNEDLLYKLFGVNAELLIDHAWGYEPCTIADIKAYKPLTNSVSMGQVLQEPYECDKARLIVKEMTDILVLDLVDKGLVTNQIVLTIGYDIDNLKNKEIRERYKGEISVDYYGREVPKHAHGTVNLTQYSSSTSLIMEKVCQLFDQIINSKLLIRRINISANKVIKESEVHHKNEYVQLSLFTDYEQEEEKKKERIKERKIQEAMLNIKKKYGKNAVLKGMNFEEGATTRERNEQIGGHKA